MTLVVTADTVARRLGFELPLSAADQWAIEQVIGDAQADVEAYLGRPIVPEEFTDMGLWPNPDGWLLTHEPLIEILTTTAEVDDTSGDLTGLYTVVYTAGLDAVTDPALAPIRRYVTAAAMNDAAVVRLWRAAAPAAGRVITSVSAEGQSVSYSLLTPGGSPASSAAAADTPGSLPKLQSLDRWRMAGRRIYQRPGQTWNW